MSFQEEIERDQCPLRDALSQIARTCSQSREQSRRIRWIKQRADWALKGKKYEADAFDLPRSAGNSASVERARATSMKNERDRAQDQLAAALFLLKEAKEISRLFDDELTAQISRFIARNSQSKQQPGQGEGDAA